MSFSPKPVKWIFTCDRCGNTADFYHGMSTFSIGKEKETYCSEICVHAVIRERGEVPYEITNATVFEEEPLKPVMHPTWNTIKIKDQNYEAFQVIYE